MSETQNIALEPNIINTIRRKLEMEWPGESIYFFDRNNQPNNDGWRAIELWSRRNAIPDKTFCCIICELNHSHTLCPGCNMPAIID